MTPKTQFLEDMKKFEALTAQYDASVSQLCSVGFSPHAPLIEATDRVMMAMADMIADKYGIHRDSLSWFIYENNFGQNKMECHRDDGKNIKIKNAADFWRFENGGK